MFPEERPKLSELSKVPEVRVSCAAFADITAGERRGLTINKTRWDNKGIRVLTPVGGAIELTQGGISTLCKLLNIDQCAFENGADLRLIMQGKHANDLREWFLSRQGRELDPDRELREELIQETGLLASDDFRGIIYGHPKYQTELAVTDKAGQEGKLTLRLIEVYPTTFNNNALQKLLSAAEQLDSMIKFVTDDEIARGYSNEGIEIRAVARSLIRPNTSIPRF